jgi:hypothetical protein
MKFFRKAPDGGKDSGVTGYFLVEIKPLFSIVLLHFKDGTRDAYHSHAFNALTLWLRGRVIEHRISGLPHWQDGPYEQRTEHRAGQVTAHCKRQTYSTGRFKFTSRENMHKVEALGDVWALSIRGPWAKTWKEFKNGTVVTLTNGRQVVNEANSAN